MVTPPARCSPPVAGPNSPAARSGGWSSSTWQLHAAGVHRSQLKKITPHALRHTAAMRMLHAPPPIDTGTIALWLGHEDLDSTSKYIHADMALKQRALDRTTPLNTKPGRYRPPDPLLRFLESL